MKEKHKKYYTAIGDEVLQLGCRSCVRQKQTAMGTHYRASITAEAGIASFPPNSIAIPGKLEPQNPY